MAAPEITPEARQEIADALKVLAKNQVIGVRAEDHQGWWVIPVGSAWQNTQVFRPFWISKAEMI